MVERRRDARFRPVEPVFGRVKSTLTARILDLSPRGVRVEVGSALRVTAECDVVLPAPGGELRLRARVLRCRAFAGSMTDSGHLVFRAGLEFLGVGEDAARALAEVCGPEAPRPGKEKGGTPRGPISVLLDAGDVTRERAEPDEGG